MGNWTDRTRRQLAGTWPHYLICHNPAVLAYLSSYYDCYLVFILIKFVHTALFQTLSKQKTSGIWTARAALVGPSWLNTMPTSHCWLAEIWLGGSAGLQLAKWFGQTSTGGEGSCCRPSWQPKAWVSLLAVFVCLLGQVTFVSRSFEANPESYSTANLICEIS